MALNCQAALDAAFNTDKAQLAAGYAQQNFRDAYAGAIKVTIALQPEQADYVRDECTFPIVFTPRDPITHDHPEMAAIRQIIRAAYERSIPGGVSNLKVKTLVIGATEREFTKYNSNPAIAYYFAGVETKDVERIVLNAVAVVAGDLEKKNRKTVSTSKFRTKRIETLRQLYDDLAASGELPAFITTRPVPANVLLFEDSIYNYTSEQLADLFEQTGATQGLGYMMLPFELTYPDYAPSTLYSFERVSFEKELYAHMTFPGGYCNGYMHKWSTWNTLLKHSILHTNGSTYLAHEIVCRVGPMVVFKLFRATPGDLLVRQMSIPEKKQWVRVLDIYASVNHRNFELIELKYISVLKHEFFQIVNYNESLKEDSITFANTTLAIRRRLTGMTLSTIRQPAWKLRPEHVKAVATTAVIYVKQGQKDLNKALAKLDLDTWKSKWKNALSQTFKVLTHPIDMLLDWLFARQLQDQLVLWPEHEGARVDYCRVPRHAQKFLPLEIVLKTPSDMLLPELPDPIDPGGPPPPPPPGGGGGGGGPPSSPPPDESDAPKPPAPVDPKKHVVPKGRAPCFVCDALHAPGSKLGEQQVKCRQTNYQHTFGFTIEERSDWYGEILDDENKKGLPAQLGAAMKRFRDSLVKVNPFTHAAYVHMITGPPGNGKTWIIKMLSRHYSRVLYLSSATHAPFTKLAGSYLDEFENGRVVHSYHFKTQHRILDIKTCDILFVDECSAVDYRFVNALVGQCKPEHVFFVGDEKQTRILPEEGVYFGDKIDMTQISRHDLRVNHRCPTNILLLLREKFGYDIIPGSGQKFSPVILIDEVEGKKKAQTIKSMYFTHEAIKQYAPRNAADEVPEHVTVRSWQGSDTDDVVLFNTQYDGMRNVEEPTRIVALSRHKRRLYIASVDSPVAREFLHWLNLERYNDPKKVEEAWADILSNERDEPDLPKGCLHIKVPTPYPYDVRTTINTNVIHGNVPNVDVYGRQWETGSCVDGAAGIHAGQRKLAVMELLFLREHLARDTHIVYAGAAPGDHLPFLIHYFSKYNPVWHLFDPRFTKLIEGARTYAEPLTNERAKRFRQEHPKADVLFISDIRRDISDVDMMARERVVDDDMKLQAELVKWLRPRYSSLKFRLARLAPTVKYFAGEILFQPWAGETSAEARIFTDAQHLTVYSVDAHEAFATYYNVKVRGQSHKCEDKLYCTDCFVTKMYLTRAGVDHSSVMPQLLFFKEEKNVKRPHDVTDPRFNDECHTFPYNYDPAAPKPPETSKVSALPGHTYEELIIDFDENILNTKLDITQFADHNPSTKRPISSEVIDDPLGVGRSIGVGAKQVTRDKLLGGASEMIEQVVAPPFMDAIIRPGDNWATLQTKSPDFAELFDQTFTIEPRCVTFAEVIDPVVNLKAKPEFRIGQPGYDAYLVAEFLFPGQEALQSAFILSVTPTLNEFESQRAVHNGESTVINVDEAINGINARGHPKTTKNRVYKASVGLGHTFFSRGNQQAIKTVLDRYDSGVRKPRVTAELKTLCRQMVAHFIATYKKEGFMKFDQFIEDEAALGLFVSDAIKDATMRKYFERLEGVKPGDSLDTIRFRVKTIFKPTNLNKEFDPDKPGQGTCTTDVRLAMFMIFFRMLAWLDRLGDKTDGEETFITDHGKTDEEFISQVAAQMRRMGSNLKFVGADCVTHDATQGPATAELEDTWYVEGLGAPPNVIAFYREVLARPTLLMDFLVAITDAKTSGKLDTLFGNTTLTKLIFAFCLVHVGSILVCSKGDDAWCAAQRIQIDENMLTRMLNMFGLRMWMKIRTRGTYCGFLYSEAGMFPDVRRRIQKVLGNAYRSYEHWCEYQKSLRDFIRTVENLGLPQILQANALAHETSQETIQACLESIQSFSCLNKRQFHAYFMSVEQDDTPMIDQNGAVVPAF